VFPITIAAEAVSTIKGLINTTAGATPFYTNNSQNPVNISLNSGECQNVTWWVNATGTVDNVYTFFGYANLTSNLSISNRTNNINITIISAVEVAPITIALLSPNNNTWNNSLNISFTFNVTATNNLTNCSLWTNETSWSLKQTNTSAIISGNLSEINETFDSDGIYLWNIECYDNLGNSAFNNTNYTIKVDTTFPIITLLSPSNNSVNNSQTLTFQANATDSNLKNCSLYTNETIWSAKEVNSSCVSGTPCKITETFSSDSTFLWNYECFDYAGNSNFSINNYTIRIDSTPPIINVTEPPLGSAFKFVNFRQDFNVSINELGGNCTLNDTKWSYTSGNSTFFHFRNNTALGEQNHTINVSCWDEALNNASQLHYFTIDNTAPAIFSPPNASIERNIESLNVDFNCTDALTSIDSFFINWTSLFQINSSGGLTNSSALNSVAVYIINVSCNDSANNINSSIYQVNVSDSTDPFVNITFPQNNSVWGQSTITYNVTTDEPTSSCKYSIDGTANQSMLQINSQFYQAADALADGLHNISACCVDPYSNEGCSTLNFFTINTNAPIVSLLSPDDNANFTSNQNIELLGYFETPFNPGENCSAYHNESGWQINKTNTPITNGTNQSFIINFSTQEGFILWNIECCNIFSTCAFNDTNRTFRIDQLSPRIDCPSSVNLEFFFDSMSVDCNATDLSPLDQWTVNNTNFSIDSSGIITNATLLQVDIFSINITINDTFGNLNFTTMQVNVNDTRGPTFTFIPSAAILAYGIDSLSVDFNASDPSGIDSWFINWTTNFSIDANGTLTNTTLLNIGLYVINVSVNDTYGNVNSTIYNVTVNDTLFPNINFTAPTTQAGNYTQNWIASNVTASDNLAIDTITTNLWNSSGIARTNTSSTSPFFWNITSLADGTYYLNATVNDTSNNLNSTETRTYILDTTAPRWQNNLTNLSINSNLGDSVYFNITLNDSNPDSYIFSFYNSTDWINDSPLNYTNGETVQVIKTLLVDNVTVNWTWFLNDTFGNQNQTDIWDINLLREKSINLSFGPDNITVFRVQTCGPDFTNSSAVPQGQNSSHGIDYICSEGNGGTGDIQIRLSSNPNPGWTWWASNTSISTNLINLTTDWQTIYSGLSEGTCTYFWHKFNCSNVNQTVGAYEQYKVI
jgi:hypothetical protein